MPVELNLHLELPAPWAARARELSRALAPLGNAIDLDATAPHVTVYLATFPSADAVIAALADLGGAAIEARVTGVRFAGRGYVFLDLDPAPLAALHGAALERLSPLRRGLVPEDVRALASRLSPRERALAEKHAFPWVEELYAPHVTVAKLPEGREAEARALLPTVASLAGEVRFETLALGATGPNGTVARTLGRRTLASGL